MDPPMYMYARIHAMCMYCISSAWQVDTIGAISSMYFNYGFPNCIPSKIISRCGTVLTLAMAHLPIYRVLQHIVICFRDTINRNVSSLHKVSFNV